MPRGEFASQGEPAIEPGLFHALCYNGGMSDGLAQRRWQFALWRLFWWVTFVAVSLSIFKATGLLAAVLGMTLLALLLAKLVADEAPR